MGEMIQFDPNEEVNFGKFEAADEEVCKCIEEINTCYREKNCWEEKNYGYWGNSKTCTQVTKCSKRACTGIKSGAFSQFHIPFVTFGLVIVGIFW